MRPLTTSALLESRSAPGPRIALGKLKLATADEYARRLCPQSDSNRHCTDFESVSACSPVFACVHFSLFRNVIHP